MIVSSIEVIGDSGEAYKVSVDPVRAIVTCECPAYRFAKDKGIALCKHIRFVADIVAGSD